MRTASRPPGRSPTPSWSPGTAAPSGCSRSAVRPARTRPSPRHSTPYPHPPVPDEPAIAAVRERLAAQGLHPFSLPLAIDIDRWLRRAATPWDAFPDTRSGKLDAETAPLAQALRSPDVSLVTGASSSGCCWRRTAGGSRASSTASTASAGCCGPGPCPGRRCRELGRAPAALALRRRRQPLRRRRPLLHEPQLHGHAGGRPARARTTRSTRRRSASTTSTSTTGAAARRSATSSSWARSPARSSRPTRAGRPGSRSSWLARHSVDWYLMSEDLPDPESRVRVDGETIVLDWRRSNMTAHHRLVARMRELFQRRRLPDRARPPLRPPHAFAPVRHGPLRHRSRHLRPRPVLPRPRPPQPVRGRRLVPADLGRGQPGAHHRRPGAARRRPSGRGTGARHLEAAHA